MNMHLMSLSVLKSRQGAINKVNRTAEVLIIEIPGDGQLKVEDKLVPFQAKRHAGLVLVIFVDDEAALGEVGLVVELGRARVPCGVERYAKHPQRVLLAQVDSGVPHVHQPLQQGEEVLLVVLYCPGYGLLQLGLSGKGARQLISGLDPLLGHLGLLLACARSGPVGHTLSDTQGRRMIILCAS